MDGIRLERFIAGPHLARGAHRTNLFQDRPVAPGANA